MTSSCTFERWTMMAALFVVTSQVLGISGPVGAAEGRDTLLSPTPLVLKDGRIANVSIHLLPFGRGDGTLDGAAAAELARLTAEVATDCFLTAQVIGHVSSREIADNETLAAHRLARSRADAVQSSLIGGGLPAKSIASVWDWQFLVREPRATLWVFRLIQGEDCEGLPLDGSAPQLVADDATPAQAEPMRTARAEAAAPVAEADAAVEMAQTAKPEPVAAADAPAPAAMEHQAPAPTPGEHAVAASLPMVSSAVAAEVPPAEARPADAEASSEALDAIVAAVAEAEATLADRAQAAPEQPGAPAAPRDDARAERAAGTAGSSSEATRPARRDQREEVVAAPSAVGAVPTVTRPIPALSPSPAPHQAGAGVAGTTVAALERAPARAAEGAEPAAAVRPPTQQSSDPQDPKRQGSVEWGQDGNVVITFATNSSYFPPGTARRLSTMIAGMTAAERYRVQLRVGTSGTDKVVGATTPEEARRYNRWLAERRVVRVQDWLKENAHDRQLEIEPVFQADDSSRRVVVRVVPVS